LYHKLLTLRIKFAKITMTTTPNARSPGGDTEFAGQLFFRLWRASHTRFAEALESLGLKPAHFALLNVLGTRKGAIQQQREFASRAEDEVLRGLRGAERRELLSLMRRAYSAAPEQPLWSAEGD
jgi:hypothetical protein